MRSVVSVNVIFIRTETLNKITKKVKRKTKQSCKVQQHNTENKYPQTPGGNRLPKYGSQSETTIDSSDWEPYQAKHIER